MDMNSQFDIIKIKSYLGSLDTVYDNVLRDE